MRKLDEQDEQDEDALSPQKFYFYFWSIFALGKFGIKIVKI